MSSQEWELDEVARAVGMLYLQVSRLGVENQKLLVKIQDLQKQLLEDKMRQEPPLQEVIEEAR